MKELFPSRPFPFVLGWFAAALLVSVSFGGQANDGRLFTQLDDALEDLATDMASYVAANKRNQISVGSFDGPASFNDGVQTYNPGAVITQGLTERLEGKQAGGVEMKVATFGSSFSVSGDYAIGKRNGKLVMVIKANIKDALGSDSFHLTERIVANTADVVRVSGGTGDFSDEDNPQAPETDDDQVADKVLDSIAPTRRQISETDNVFFASPRSPYGVEILTKNSAGVYESVPSQLTELPKGFGKVALTPDDIFAIRIHNRSDKKVGLLLTIDGINVFAFSERDAWKKIGKMIVIPGTATIKGWHHQGDRSHEFVITNYGKSAAARLGATGDLGTITATFVEALPAKGAEDFGVGFGSEVVVKYRSVPADFGKVIAAVSVHYLRPTVPNDLPPG